MSNVVAECILLFSRRLFTPSYIRSSHLTEYLEVVRPKLLRGKKSDILFVTKSGNEIPAENLCYIVRTRARTAGLSQQLNPHTMRHACATHMLREYLSIRKSLHGPLFVNHQTGRRLSCNHISKVFRRRLGYKTHAMRHACATHLLQNGCDVRIVQELLGHQKIDTTGIYTHLKTGDLRRAVERNHPRNKIPET